MLKARKEELLLIREVKAQRSRDDNRKNLSEIKEEEEEEEERGQEEEERKRQI